MCTLWTMPNIKINTSNFLTPVIYSYPACLAWFGENTCLCFPPVGLLSQPIVLFISIFSMHLLVCSHYSVKALSWCSVILYQRYSWLGGCAIPLCMTTDLLACCIFPLCLSFSDFVLHSQWLWEKGCHFALLVQCLAECTKMLRSYYKSKLRMIFRYFEPAVSRKRRKESEKCPCSSLGAEEGFLVTSEARMCRKTVTF